MISLLSDIPSIFFYNVIFKCAPKVNVPLFHVILSLHIFVVKQKVWETTVNCLRKCPSIQYTVPVILHGMHEMYQWYLFGGLEAVNTTLEIFNTLGSKRLSLDIAWPNQKKGQCVLQCIATSCLLTNGHRETFYEPPKFSFCFFGLISKLKVYRIAEEKCLSTSHCRIIHWMIVV